MTLVLGDSFKIFKKYKISNDEVFEAYSNPTQFESLMNNVSLYLKYFYKEDKNRQYLLVATQIVKAQELLAFCYWIPSEYILHKVRLLDVLEMFANQFGLKIKIGSQEGYFIKYAKKFVSGKIHDPTTLIDILAPQQIPCEYFLFTRDNLVGKLNTVSILYVFSLNTSKYILWLDSFPKVQIEIKSGWYDFVKNNIVEYVEPHGKTKIKVYQQKTKDMLNEDTSNKTALIEVPAIYKKQFNYISQIINGLKNNEKILFSLSFSAPICLFCRSTDTSKEHIFPKWILPFLDKTTFEGLQFLKFGDESLENITNSPTTLGKKESSHGYTTKFVCITCNNTWMSKLESEVKRIVLNNNKLIESIPENISRKDAESLSAWLILKSLLLSNKVNSNIHELKENIFRDLKSKKINNRFLVEAIRAEKSKFDFVIIKGVLHDNLLKLKKISLDRGKEMVNKFFVCSIQLNHLLFRISYLEPDIPLVRETVQVKTFKLFPFGAQTNHRIIPNEDKSWKKIIENNLEINLFGFGLILVEHNYFK